MKRNLTAEEPTEVEGPDPLKTVERQFGEAMESMVDVMSRIYRNQALKGLDKETVKKFEDAPLHADDVALLNQYQFKDANFAREFLAQARRITRKLKQRFSFDRLERLASQQLDKVDKRGREEFYKRVSDVVGIDPKRLANEEGLQARTNAMMLETAKWAEKLRDETLEMYTANSLRAMAEGKTLDDVLSQFDGMQEKRKNHAKMVARTQVATFNSLMTKARAENLGITRAVWVSANDERVRGNPSGKYPNAKPSHWWADGEEFDLAEGLKFPSGGYYLPGTPPNCRCTYKLIIPKGE